MREIKFRRYNTMPNKTSFKKGHKKLLGSFGIGSRHTEKSKELIRQAVLDKTGQNARNWKGGKTKIRFLIPQLKEYKIWRGKVFERDNWTCQTCETRGVYLEAHHIKPLCKIIDECNIKNSEDAKHCEILWDINNGVTLCKECHKLTKKGYKTKLINS